MRISWIRVVCLCLVVGWCARGHAETRWIVTPERCLELARRAYDACIEAGEPQETCQAILERAEAFCEEGEPTDPPPPGETCEERCESSARAILRQCLDRGHPADVCEAKADDYRGLCLERCVGGDPGGPGPGDPCLVGCQRQLEMALAQCRMADDPRECQAAAVAAAEACLEECGVVIEPPEPPSCESLCRLRARAEEETCRQMGGDPGDCEMKGEAVLSRCLDRCDDPDLPDPPRTCEDRCESASEAYLARCLAVTGGDEAATEECRVRAARLLESCLGGCEDVPPLPCFARCSVKATEHFRECLSALPDGEDEEGIGECRRRLVMVLEECRAECEVPPFPRPCVEPCEREARELREDCVAGGGDPDECSVAAQQALRECIAASCEPPVPPPSCEDRCKARLEPMVARCIEAGNDPEECRIKAGEAVAACVEACSEPPEPPSCEDRCDALARRVFQACLRNGGEPEACRARAGRVREGCLLRCEGEIPPPPSCTDRCQHAAERLLERCLAAGGEPADCEARAAEAQEMCQTLCERPQPPTCQERCTELARRLRNRCEEEGVDPETCETRIQDMLAGCLEGCEEPRPEPPPCDERCERAAEILMKACVAEGGEPADCEQRVAAFRERCLEHCDAGPAPSCEDRCTSVSERYFAECIEDGEPEEDCRAAADALLDRCLVRCAPRPEPCGSRCAARAREIRGACLERLAEEVQACVDQGGDPRVCRARAIRRCNREASEFLARCLSESCGPQDPPPPVPCEDRCQAAAERLRQACEDRGADPEVCAARVDEFLAACLEHCEAPEPPPCDAQCDEVGEQIRQRCLDAGQSEEDCSALAERVVQRCERRLGEICDLEIAALIHAPIAFKRGDVNRDQIFDISDIIGTLSGIFLGKHHFLICEDAVDMNDDGRMDISDAVVGLFKMFRAGGPLPSPATNGHDPTADELICGSE